MADKKDKSKEDKGQRPEKDAAKTRQGCGKAQGYRRRTAKKAAKPAAAAEAGAGKAAPSTVPTPRMKQRYHDVVVPALMKEFQYKNPMQAPKLVKIVLNVGYG